MGFISKVELKKQLQQMGIKVEGEYVQKKDLIKVVEAGDVITFPKSKRKTGTEFLKETVHLKEIEKVLKEREFPIDQAILDLLIQRRNELKTEIDKVLENQ